MISQMLLLQVMMVAKFKLNKDNFLNIKRSMIGLGVACSQHFAGLPGGRVNLQGLVPGGLGGGPYSRGVV